MITRSVLSSLVLFSAAGLSQLSAQISVNSANPNAAAQGAINLNVTIGGSGFKHGANSQFFVSGTINPGGITVNSTAFVSSTQLTADISVSSTADIANFDIVVQNADGRTGKGVGLFSVQASGQGSKALPVVSLQVTVNPFEQLDPMTGTATNVLPDSFGPYVDGQNGVCATFDSQGDLNVTLNCSAATTPRRFELNLSNFLAPPTGGTNTCSPPAMISSSNPPVAYSNNLISGQAANANTAAFQAMAIYDGTSATIYYVQTFINWQFSDASHTDWRLNFHRPNSVFSDAALASYIQVRRLTSTRWVAEPIGASSLASLGNPPNTAMLIESTSGKHSYTNTECGFYLAPFSFTLDQQ